jgi:hypothetical protein
VNALASVVSRVVEDAKLTLAAQSQSNDELTKRQRYALDPFALLDDGHVRILDEHGGISVFHPYPHQRETLEEWIDLAHLRATAQLRFRNVHIEKSRQMGETWILAYACWWALAFHNVQGLMMHTDWGRVDDGGEKNTPESFFGKIRFINRYIDTSSAGIARPGLIFKSPHAPGGAAVRVEGRPDSYIAGTGQDKDPARGSRLRFAIVDEAAHVPYSERVHQSLGDACPQGKAYNSTPMGEGNAFARIKRTRPSGWRFLRFHWSQHPEYGKGQHIAGSEPDTCGLCRETKAGLRWPTGGHRYPGRLTSPWYDSRIADRKDEDVAAELDIDYTGSLTARVFPEWQPELHLWGEPSRLFDPNLPVELGWDFGIADPTAIVICQDGPDSYRVVGEYEAADATPDQVALGLIEILAGLGIAHPLTREWTRQILSVGDVAGKARSMNTGTSLWQDYGVHGWVMTGAWATIDHTLTATRRLLRGIPKPLLVDAEACPRFVQHVAGYRWPTDVDGNRRAGAAEPKHDEHSHMMSAFRYLITHKFPPPSDDQAMPPPPPDPGPALPNAVFKPGMAF